MSIVFGLQRKHRAPYPWISQRRADHDPHPDSPVGDGINDPHAAASDGSRGCSLDAAGGVFDGEAGEFTDGLQRHRQPADLSVNP